MSRDRLTGLNEAYVLERYDRYREDPASVSDSMREVFERPGRLGSLALHTDEDVLQIVGAVNLAEAIRRYGHLAARIDPLGGEPQGDPALEPGSHGIDEATLRRLPPDLVGGPACEAAETAFDAIETLREVYCSTTGHDYAHIFVPEEREWLREAAECRRFRAPNDPIDPRKLLRRLTRVEVFERFLHRTFPGKTRFSIEGLDMLVPVIEEVIGEAAEAAVTNAQIGMAHRGRLNVLAHVLYKPYAQILAEFRDPGRGQAQHQDMAWSGDVKYHLGARRSVEDVGELDLVISMPPNSSHLEAIDPIVEGMARAAGTKVDEGGTARFDPAVTIPILVHGDLAFPGQGVVAETLNLGQLPGYTTGGTIHIITNNQLGFTTDPGDAYSTKYASGFARGYKIPIVHVNADDVEACIEAARLAFAYLHRFHRDFIIDLVGYRRHGHNEGDEPSFTQPRMYTVIRDHPTVRAQWAALLIERGDVDPSYPDTLVERDMGELQEAFEAVVPERDLNEAVPQPPPPGAARQARTRVPLGRLREFNAELLSWPDDFSGHPKLAKARERRRHVLDDPDERTVEWAAAEELALASILADGVPIRLTGEDVERGTFSHRHAVFHDVETGATHVPLQKLPQARAAFEIHNSPLTENAVIGFEYGYNVQAPDRLVIWEAQYGDFINGAQVMLDEFLVSARNKWGQTPSLVLLLPHGQEGQGPDHASGRPERFLQLAADTNLRIANCTTAAQYFHLLRRQASLLATDPLPLVVFTPKSLLRHPLVASAPRDLAEGRWLPVIDDERAAARRADIRRLVLCTGKIHVDLVSSERREEATDVALCRVEQLYPFPVTDLAEIVAGYPGLTDVLWLQEEPENMGAWDFVRPLLEDLLGDRLPLGRVARPRNASPADGSSARHAASQAGLVERAFAGVVPRRRGPRPAKSATTATTRQAGGSAQTRTSAKQGAAAKTTRTPKRSRGSAGSRKRSRPTGRS